MQLTVCTPKGKPLPEDNMMNIDAQWFREGKTVFFTNRSGDRKEVMAFLDLAGNGVIIKVPPKVKKPNGFVRFFEKINRAFGGKGLKSVNKYQEYTQTNSTLTEQARGKSVNDE